MNPQSTEEKLTSMAELMEVVYELRQKCPWDREQTWDTLRHLTLEEVHELNDALLSNDSGEVRKELGDLLLHILFYAMIAEEEGKFHLGDIAESLRIKLIARHPHVYGETVAKDAETVKQNWEQIKLQEGAKGVLAGVPSGLPSLVKAYRLGEKAASVGFDWKEVQGVREKVSEELAELDSADTEETRLEELGDLLFTLASYARHLGINPDTALERANAKFKSRFEKLETEAKLQGHSIRDLSMEELDSLWNAVKIQD